MKAFNKNVFTSYKYVLRVVTGETVSHGQSSRSWLNASRPKLVGVVKFSKEGLCPQQPSTRSLAPLLQRQSCRLPWWWRNDCLPVKTLLTLIGRSPTNESLPPSILKPSIRPVFSTTMSRHSGSEVTWCSAPWGVSTAVYPLEAGSPSCPLVRAATINWFD